MKIEVKTLLGSMIDEEKGVFETLIDFVHYAKGELFFLYGYSGIEKTYIWRTLTSLLRSEGRIFLTVASNGITLILLVGG